MEHRNHARSARHHSRWLLGAILCASATIIEANAQTAPMTQGCVINGGNNANVNQTCIFNPKFGLTADSIKSVIVSIPLGKRVKLITVGGNRAQDMGNDLQRALIASGFSVDRMKVGQMSPPADDPLTIDTLGPETDIVLDPAALGR